LNRQISRWVVGVVKSRYNELREKKKSKCSVREKGKFEKL
jgi:hypothetical protein